MSLNPQTGLQQFGFFKKIAKKLLKPPGGSKFIKKTLLPPGLKKSLEYSLLPHRALGMSERDLLMPHRALRRGKDRGIGGLPRKLLEGRQFPRGIPEQFRQLPFGPPTMQPMVPWDPPATVPEFLPNLVTGELERTSPSPMQPLPRGPELIPIQQEVRGMDRFTPEQIEAMKNQYMSTMPVGPAIPFQPLPEEMPMPSLTPEEITQQRIDQVSQFEQEPMTGGDRLANIFGSLGTRYGAFGGSATNLPDYTTMNWEGIGPARFSDARFDPQRIGYADTGMRSDGDRPYALPGGYAGGGIADLLRYYGR
jgi:hypothetical protein